MVCHSHDRRWVAEQIGKLPPKYRSKAQSGYEAAYIEAAEAEPMEHRKENAARFAANSRLRLFVERVTK